MFALQNSLSTDFELPGLSASVIEEERRAAKFDLSLIVEEKQSIVGFDKSTARICSMPRLFNEC